MARMNAGLTQFLTLGLGSIGIGLIFYVFGHKKSQHIAGILIGSQY
ncbi:hypothetical protein TUM4445_34710 [Shewanella sp. MBTL60-112-B2]|nr:hypothetical protein TUM4444_25740 [Shewanella sp. MBTL60-112-B1]GIU39125.1 hypothetical protein TUM4445_34710 [Shewanella sp. MBTL60-112-B2]